MGGKLKAQEQDKLAEEGKQRSKDLKSSVEGGE